MTKPRLVADTANDNTINGSKLEDSSVDGSKISAGAAIDSSKLSYSLGSSYGSVTIGEKLSSDLLSVKDFGAKGDGISNDTTSIQDAINYCAQYKKKLFFPSGTYLCGSIEVKSNLEVIGEDGAVIKRTSNYGWQLGLFYTPPVNVLIENLQFDNNAPGTSGTHKHSVRMTNTQNVVIRNCRFFNGYDSAIKDLGPDGIYISTGSPSTVNNILIEGCLIEGFTRNGISITDGANGVVIRDCTISNCGLTGVDVEANTGTSTQVRNLTIDNCKFIDNGDVSVGPYTSRTGQLSIFSSGPTVYHSENVTVSNCYFKNSSANPQGINSFKINSTKNFLMFNCYFESPVSASTYRAVFEEGTFGSMSGAVKNCTFVNHNVDCFDFTNIVFDSNHFSGTNTRYASAGTGSNKKIVNNFFENCATSGVPVLTIRSPGFTISHNSFLDDRTTSIPDEVLNLAKDGFTTTSESIISSNIVKSKTAKYGSFVRIEASNTGVSRLKILGNRVTSCDDGIVLYSGTACSDIEIENNTFEGIADRAIALQSASRVSVSGNSFLNCSSESNVGSEKRDVIFLRECSGYLVISNKMIDTRTGSSRARYGLRAFDTPLESNLISGNLAVNMNTGGFSIALGEASNSNNVSY